MGKRKREETKEDEDVQHTKRVKVEPTDEDENENDGDSSRSSIYLPEELYNDIVDDPDYNSRPKKRDTIPTYSSSEDIPNGLHSESPRKEDTNPMDSSSEDLPNGLHSESPRKENRKLKKSEETNGVEEESSDYTFYLIRKPVDVKIKQLENLKLSRLADGKKAKLKTDAGNYILKSEQVPKPLVYFPSAVVMTEKDAQKIKSSGFITSQAVLTPYVKEIPGGPIYNNEEEIPSDAEMMFPISSIRKQPKVDLENKRERLKAFGVKREKKRRSKAPKPEPMSAGSSSPSEPIAGGQDMSEGIMAIVRPAIQQLDNQVSSTRQSQVILASKIQELADIMHDMCEDQPYDLNQYSRKLADSKRRVQSTGKLLEKVHDRLSNLQREIAREAHAKKTVITGIPPAAPLR